MSDYSFDEHLEEISDRIVKHLNTHNATDVFEILRELNNKIRKIKENVTTDLKTIDGIENSNVKQLSITLYNQTKSAHAQFWDLYVQLWTIVRYKPAIIHSTYLENASREINRLGQDKSTKITDAKAQLTLSLTFWWNMHRQAYNILIKGFEENAKRANN